MITQSNPMALLCETMLPLMIKGDSYTFPRFIENICRLTEEAIREAIKNYLENLDLKFRNSNGRTNTYHVKEYLSRTIITIYGEITYKRTIYENKYDHSRFCYVDVRMGIDKYIRYTNDVGSLVYEAYADTNSMIKVGEVIGSQIYAKYSLLDKRTHAIPRQTIYNLLKRVKEVRKLEPGFIREDISDIYILLDEKYIPCQDKLKDDEKRKDIMAKTALIVEGLDKTNKRHKYLNTHHLSTVNGDLTTILEDYLNSKYNTDKIERFHIMSDGGSWIKGLYNDLLYPREKKIKYLDKFHGFNSLWAIADDKDIYSSLLKLLYKKDKEELFKVINRLKDIYPSRKEIVEKESKYLSNNYQEIIRTIEMVDMNCAMEQVISHHLASQFTSVAKAYSSNNLDRYLSMRDNYKNRENLRKLYLTALNDKSDEKVLILNKPTVNQSLFTGNRTSGGTKTSEILEDENLSLHRGQEDDDYN